MPQGKTGIAAVFNKFNKIAIRHRPPGDLKILEQYLMAREFIIETKPPAGKAYFIYPALNLHKSVVTGFNPLLRNKILAVGGEKRVCAQREFKVGEQKLLVLLLMVEAQ